MSAASTIEIPAPPVTGTPAVELPNTVQAPRRNVAVDAYRGLVMLLMMGEVMNFVHMHHAFPDSLFWRILAYNQDHVQWAGLGLHDMIQPSFTFLVGVAMPYSIASRIRKGQSFGHLMMHTIFRAILLTALGVLLRSTSSTMTNFTFEDTLSQIGMGYTFAFLLSFCKPKWQWTAFGAILFGYWLAWALYPAPGPNFDYAAVGVPADWHHNFSGFASHWNKNSNLGQAFDVWFLNKFRRLSPFLFNEGGYLTLSFIPTLGTMLLGLFAGQWFRAAAPNIPLKKFLIAGASLMALGALFHFTGICPIVKRIWTPAWTLFSGGICFLFLAAFSWIVDVKDNRKVVFPLVVVGMNSMAAYLIAHLWEEFIINNLYTNLTHAPFQIFGVASEPLVMGITVMLVYWCVLYWMYKNKIFLRI
ncbi:acyltransferase family protein [Silvibacterium acidisoli]|uniref:acyltransferase family protein n=1 Tax=Acidobacteriaceae bacterium ZG23-2 TaxID=2883246 RepID=UPI00406CAC6D